MSHEGHMNFFQINRCGLYKVGKEEVYGCGITETFDLISAWRKDKPFASTIPWDPESRPNRPKCYCREIHKDPVTGDFFLVLWKSDTDSAGTLWGAPEEDKTGESTVVKYTNEYKGKKVIWGRPAYYWVIPSLNTVVSIKFEHSVCDAALFQEWVIGCINNRVSHPNKVKSLTDTGIVRLSFSDSKEENPYKYLYRFDVSLRSLNTSTSELQALASRVTHIVRRTTVRVDATDQRAGWVKTFNNLLPFVSGKPNSKKRQIEIRAEAKPTAAEIKKLIEENAKEERKRGDWDNVGFHTDSGVTWVDRYRLRDSIVLSKDKGGILSAKVLCSEILRKRNSILKPLLNIEGKKSGAA